MGDLLKDLVDKGPPLVGGPAKAGATLGAGGITLAGSAAKDAASDAVQGAAEEFLWEFAQSVVDGTQVLFHMVIDLLLQLTEPQVTGEFIYTMGGRIFFISLPLIVTFAAIRIIAASLRAQALTGARDAFLGAGVSVLGTVALVPLTSLAVSAVDSVANGLISATLRDGKEFVDDVMAAVVQVGTMVGNTVSGEEVSGPVKPWDVAAGGAITTSLICITAAGLLMVACVIIGLALVARNMLLYIVIVIGPLCLSGLAWEPTRRWASIWLGWMVALIFTKLAIVIVMGLGVLAVTATIQSGEVTADPLPGLTTVLSGILMLLLAAFMPVACFALFGWMGEAGVRELQNAADGAQGMMTSAPASALSASQTAGGRLSSLLGGSDKGGDAGLAGGGAGETAGGTAAMETEAAVGTTAATGGTAAPVMVAAEAANEVKETGEAVADEVKDNVEEAVSETTGTDVGDSAPESSSGDGGQDSFSWEQEAPGDSAGGGESAAPVVAEQPMSGEGPAEAEPAPVDASPAAGTESSAPVESAPGQMSITDPEPVPTDTGAAPEVRVEETPPAPVSAPQEIPVTGKNSEGGK